MESETPPVESTRPPAARPVLAHPAVSAAPPPRTPPPASPLTLPLLTRRQAALDLMLIALVTLGIPMAQMLAGSLAFGDVLPSGDLLAFILRQKWLECGLILAIAAYLLKRHGLPPAAFGMRFNHPWREAGWSLAGLGAAYGALILSIIFVLPVILLSPESGEAAARDRLEFARQLPLDNVWLTMLLLVAVAIGEELLFRGLLVTYLRRVTGNWIAAIALSSVVFGALHVGQGYIAIPQAMLLGAALAIIFVLSRSLTAVIIAHFLFDLLQFQLMRLLTFAEPLLEQQAALGGT